MLFKLCLGRFFFSSEDALDIFTYTFIVKARKWRSRQAISRINSTCPRQQKYARNQFWKVQVNLVHRFSLLFLSCGRVVGWRGPWSDLITWPPGFWVVKNICWKGGVAEFPQCQGEKSTVSGWEDCCHFPTSVYALMETFRQIFILRIV